MSNDLSLGGSFLLAGAAVGTALVIHTIFDKHRNDGEIQKALQDQGYSQIRITDSTVKERLGNVLSCGKNTRKMHFEAVSSGGEAVSGMSCQHNFRNDTRILIARGPVHKIG